MKTDNTTKIQKLAMSKQTQYKHTIIVSTQAPTSM